MSTKAISRDMATIASIMATHLSISLVCCRVRVFRANCLFCESKRVTRFFHSFFKRWPEQIALIALCKRAMVAIRSLFKRMLGANVVLNKEWEEWWGAIHSFALVQYKACKIILKTTAFLAYQLCIVPFWPLSAGGATDVWFLNVFIS